MQAETKRIRAVFTTFVGCRMLLTTRCNAKSTPQTSASCGCQTADAQSVGSDFGWGGKHTALN